jgi:hypothetical protein
MSTPREQLLGTKTASIPPLKEGAGFFSHYVPTNDTFDGRKNNVQVGIRPSWVLQARELTEIQSILTNQFRMMVEGDEIQINTPFTQVDETANMISYGGVRGGWTNPNKFPASYEVTRDFVNGVPQSVVDKYNSVYGPIDVGGVEHGGVGNWLRVTPYNDEVLTYPNFKDFKRITFGPGFLYAVSQHGLLPYFAHVKEKFVIDLYGWWPSRRGYAEDRYSGSQGYHRHYIDPDGDGTYPPNEQNANGSGGVNSGNAVGRHPDQPLGELIEQFPDVAYFMGLSFTETLVKPGVSSKTDRFLLDNAAGYNNHDAPGAYRIKHSIIGGGTGDYIPVFTGELAPRALGLFNSLVDFPWDGEWVDRYQNIKNMLESDSDEDQTQGQSDAVLFIIDLGFEPKEGDGDRPDETKRVVMYRYPSIENYYNIFKEYGIRRIFTDTENHLDDREKNRLLLNPNSVVWDYRLIDPEYLQDGGYLPQDPSIGNGLIDTYLTSENYESLFGFALGTNSSTDPPDLPGNTDCGEYDYHWFSKKDPMYIPYVSTSKYGIISDLCRGEEEGSFLENNQGGSLEQTRLHIRSLSANALQTNKEINFLPLLHFSYNQMDKLHGFQIFDSGDIISTDQVFDMREIRFIIPPAPNWDWTNEDENGIEIPYEWYVYSTAYNKLLPWQAYNTSTYFNNEMPYSWLPGQ